MRPITCLTSLLIALTAAGAAWAQNAGGELAQNAPRFLLAQRSAPPVPVDVSRTPILQRRISVKLEGVMLEDALATVSRAAGLRLFYSTAVVPLDRVVRLLADDISVASALTELLLGADVDVVFSGGAQAVLVRRGTLPQGGTITGRVTDATTQLGVANVRVFLDRTRWGTTTDSAGGYRLTQIDPGAYTLVARRIGYRPATQSVTVEADRETTVDVALQAAPSDLEAVVVTATGEQRLLELGHTVGRINADSLVRAAPVTTLSELLTARVPGLQVFQTQGTVGGRVQLQLRGPNSFSVSNEPIVIIDGVRYTTAERPLLRCCIYPGSQEATSPLNDLNPNDVESIEVVKGPSAATLYGTEAASGVLVIRTKHGRPGPARWNVFAKMITTEIQTENLPDIYWGWGTVSGVPNNRNLSCTLARLASGQCTQQDSVTVIRNPLKDPQYSIFAAKPTWEYGINVSGGRQDLRYYFSADFQDATGAIQMPPAMAAALREQRGLSELPREWRDPNSLTKLSLRSTVSASLGQTMELRLSTAYIHHATNALTFDGTRLYLDAGIRPTPAEPSRYLQFGRSPSTVFAREATEDVDRFVGSARGEWRPVGWLTARATLGLDLLNSARYALVRPGDDPGSFALRDGSVEDTRTRQVATTAELGVAATVRRGHLSVRTAIGAQYVRTLSDVSGSFGEGLAPGASVVPGAVTVTNAVAYRETAVLGGYLEETLGLNDRLFLTGALRVDGASTFGRDYQAAVYPKLGTSWLVTGERFVPRIPGLDELRLRYALGASGRQPDPAWARLGFAVQQMDLNGQRVNTYQNTTLGNPALRPERVREHEFGFDASAFTSRVTLAVTWFRRRTTDQLISQPGPPGIGSIYRNLGLTTQRGFEAQLEARVIATQAVSLDLALQLSDYATRLVDIGSGSMVRAVAGGYVEGYPLGARFGQPIIGWEDRNANGILEFSELARTDTAVYLGESRPPRAQTLSAVVGLLDRRVRISALLDRKSGFTQIDGVTCRNRAACREAVDRNTPLEAQAWAWTVSSQIPQPATLLRLREVSIAVDLPTRLTRTAGRLVLSGRNLALWTKFPGPDPEVGDPNQGLFVAPNLNLGSAAGVPMGRSFSVRLDLDF